MWMVAESGEDEIDDRMDMAREKNWLGWMFPRVYPRQKMRGLETS